MKLQALTGAFGAEVEGLNLGQGVNARDMQLIAEALAEKSVLVFRDQDLDIGQFEDLATSMGEFGETPFITPCLLYTSPSPRDRTRSRMPSSA